MSCQVQGLLRRVRPEWTEGHFELLEYATHGDKDKTEQLRTLGQGAFTGVHVCAVTAWKPAPGGQVQGASVLFFHTSLNIQAAVLRRMHSICCL